MFSKKGYSYNEKGELVDKDGAKFKFVDQKHYEEVAKYVRNYIQQKIINDHKAERVDIPPKSPESYVFISQNCSECEICVFLIQGSGEVRYDIYMINDLI
jgi:hypothetical protein